jgi:hypothetical protein
MMSAGSLSPSRNASRKRRQLSLFGDLVRSKACPKDSRSGLLWYSAAFGDGGAT